MNTKTLYALIACAALALVAAVWINTANTPESETSERNELLLPGLRDQINSVDALTLSGAGNKPLVTLKRAADGWSIVEKSGYPADMAKLREFLLKLADATVLEQKTGNPKRYADLGVEDPAAADAKSVLVSLGGLKQPLKLIIGLYNGQGGGGTFVRRDGDAASLLVKGNLVAEKDPGAWIRHDLLDIDSAQIKEVVLTNPDGKILRAWKDAPADANFKVADVPKGRELASEYVANSLGSGLSSLRADDVAAGKDAPAPAKVYKAHYLGFGGLVVDATAWEADGKPHVQFAVANDAAQLEADIAAKQAKAKADYDAAVTAAKLKVVEAKGDDAAVAKAEAEVVKPSALTDPAKDKAERQAAAAQVVADLNKNLNGWTFTIPAYEFSNFSKGMDDMLKALESKPGPNAKSPNSAAPMQSLAKPPASP